MGPTIWTAVRSKIFRVGWQGGDPDKGQWMLQNSLLPRGVLSFVLFKPLTDWVRPPHTVGGNLLCSVCTCLNVNFFPNTLPETSCLHHDPATHKNSHHSLARIVFIHLAWMWHLFYLFIPHWLELSHYNQRQGGRRILFKRVLRKRGNG